MSIIIIIKCTSMLYVGMGEILSKVIVHNYTRTNNYRRKNTQHIYYNTCMCDLGHMRILN